MAQEEQLFQASNKYRFVNKIKSIQPLRDHVLISDMNFSGRKLSSGVILLGDDGKTDGIRPRWGRVYAIGPEQKDVKVGQWVLIEHGRWTRGIEVEIDDQTIVLRRADPACIIGVQDEEPDYDDTISTSVYAEQKTR